MQQKQKKNERREMARDAVWRGGGGVDSVDGFLGWVDSGIDWCYDWHQRTINRAYHFSETGY